jgi:hypothetical protein
MAKRKGAKKSCRLPAKTLKLAKCLTNIGRTTTLGPKQAQDACAASIAKRRAPRRGRGGGKKAWNAFA